MGGVDVADMRRLHCTSNALVLYNEAMKGKQRPFNIADFKTKVVEALVEGILKEGGDNGNWSLPSN
jgi:hypothetical protein